MKKLVIIPNNNSRYAKILLKIKNFDLNNIFFLNEQDININQIKKFDIVIYQDLPIKLIKKISALKIILININKYSFHKPFVDIFIDPFLKNEFKTNSNPVKGDSRLSVEEISHENHLKDVLNIISILEWDSQYWKKKIAFIETRRLTNNLIYRVNKFVKKNHIEMIQFLSNCHDVESVLIAEKNNFGFKDIRITLEKKINTFSFKKIKKTSFRTAKISDFNNLKEIVKNSYLDSRYYYDSNFLINKTKKFFYGWLKKGIQGKFDDICYIICVNNQPIGFCTCKINFENSPDVAAIGLFGILKKFQGKGYSRLLLNYVEKQLVKLNKKNMKVITQGRNYTAIKAYNNYGFSIKKTELWYHKWIK